MSKVRFTPGSSLSYTLYEHKTTIRDDLHIKFKTTNDFGGLVQIETGDPNQFIKVVIKDSVIILSFPFTVVFLDFFILLLQNLMFGMVKFPPKKTITFKNLS